MEKEEDTPVGVSSITRHTPAAMGMSWLYITEGTVLGKCLGCKLPKDIRSKHCSYHRKKGCVSQIIHRDLQGLLSITKNDYKRTAASYEETEPRTLYKYKDRKRLSAIVVKE